MNRIKETEFKQLNPGDLIAIGGALHLVTHVSPHTFCSAALIQHESQSGGIPYRSSSHWVGGLDEDDEIVIFNDFSEAIWFMNKELLELKKVYNQ